MESATIEENFSHTCPSCGQATTLSDYALEPSLCIDCQRTYGVIKRLEPEHTPDLPVWGLLEGGAVWLLSIMALLAAEAAAVVYLLWIGWRGLSPPGGDAIVTDPGLLLARIAGTGVAHLITVAIAYYVVTDGGSQPFFKSIGWGLPKGFGIPTVVLVYITIYAFMFAMSGLLPAPEATPFDEMLKSSQTARIAIMIFAVVSAPFVEELVYRGVLYPAIARRFGRIFSILIVSGAFLMVHMSQYGNEPAILIPLGVLSVSLTALRAYSGSVLPSYLLHLFFNGTQVAFMLLAPYIGPSGS